jgi:hypothetical protein
MPAEERLQQIVSFAYGDSSVEDPSVSRAVEERAAMAALSSRCRSGSGRRCARSTRSLSIRNHLESKRF